MAVDKSYGSGYKNSGKSKAAALKPGSMSKTAPAVKNAKFYAAAKAKAGNSGNTYMEAGISNGLKMLYQLGKLAPKFTGQSIVEGGSAAARVGAYNAGNFNRELFSRAAKIGKMTSPKAAETAVTVKKWADAAKLRAQMLREQASSTNPTAFSRGMDARESATGVLRGVSRRSK
jgi:hypothetical protein